MGTIISKAANGIGTVIGNAFSAPIKTIFGGSCEGVCSGTWDITCFIEHLCISNLVKLLMVLGLCYISVLVRTRGHHLFSVAQAKEYQANKPSPPPRRFRDIEDGYSTSSNESLDGYQSLSVSRKRRSVGERRKDRMRRSLYPVKQSSKHRYRSRSHHHDVRLKTSKLSVHVKGGGRPGFGSSSQLQIRRGGNRRELMLLKRRRIR